MNHRIVNFAVVALALLVGTGNAIARHDPAKHSEKRTLDKAVFRSDMRKLWEDHVTWTRLYIISAMENLSDKSATTNRLLQNQTDIGNAIKPLYGDAAGNKLTALLRDHILIAAELIDAVKSGDTTRSNSSGTRWNSNADEIAEFLSGANPKNWPPAEMKSMMRSHLSATTTEVVARLKKDWEGDVRAYDEVHKQILHMSDMLSSGIISQFQAKFR
ncbi:MAG: glycosyltransferase [Bacteroidota bacterium]